MSSGLGARSLGEVPFDLVDGLLGQVLVDFRDDAALHLGMESAAQLGKGPGRRDDDQRPDLALTDDLLQGVGDDVGKPVLLDLVPVGRPNGATAGADARKGAAGLVAALLPRGRILIAQNSALSSD